MSYPSLAGFDPRDCLRLIRSENVGAITFFSVVQRFGSPAAALDAIPGLARQGGKKSITLCRKEEAEREMEATEAFGARFVLYGSEEYPALLNAIYDPPPVLIVKGDLQKFAGRKMLAIVGARNASANAYHFAQRMAREAGQAGWCVVSGLARGIDTAAHGGSLESGTIAVIANGIDHIYPPENEKLCRSIGELGAVVTEHPFGMAPHAKSFPSRNRIISGITAATLVVEASLKSGSLITARCAAEQGRDVFAVPGSPLDPRCKGTNDLLKNGAILTENFGDIATQLREPHFLRENSQEDFDSVKTAPMAAQELDRARQEIAGKLSPSPVLVDELLQQCHITAPALWTVLLEMELAGRVERHPGNKVSLRVTD